MTIPSVPEQSPGQSEIVLDRVLNPFLSVWWTSQTVSNVPENVMGWLISAGWTIDTVTQVGGTNPPTNYFSLSRQGMQPLEVLLSLCNSYTIAANEAREANQIRYNEVVANWTEMLDSSHNQFNAQTTEQNAQAGVFLTDLDEYMTAIETLIADNQSQIVSDAVTAQTALEYMDGRLADLETNAADNAVIINALLTEQDTNLQAYLTDYGNRLEELDQNVIAHIATVMSQVANLETVLEVHVAEYLQQFDQLAANYTAHLATIDGLLANVTANVETYVEDVDAILTSMSSDYQSVDEDMDGISTTAGTLVNTYAGDYQAILDLLATDYTSHAAMTRSIIDFLATDYTPHAARTRDITNTLDVDYLVHDGAARDFLDGLGATELARINEEFASKLSMQLQSLVTRGLSTSTLITDVTERNHRDRDEQIQMLNDRLNREKFDNQHRLYEQQRVTRTQTMDNEHRLYEQQRLMRTQTVDNEHKLYDQQLAMRTRSLDGENQLHSVRQEVLKYQASLISGVYALLQDVRNRTLAGKQAIFSARDAKERLWIEVQSQLYARLQDVRLKTIEATDRIYQLRDVYAKWSNAETHKLYEQLQQVKQLFVEAAERQHTAKQTVTRAEMSQRDTLLQQLQSALTALLGGKERFASLWMATANTLAEHKHRAIIERMNTATARLEGWKTVATENRQLMAYQLDTRNQLLIGLYSFVERREDVSPEWRDQATMIASLGDSAGGWVTP